MVDGFGLRVMTYNVHMFGEANELLGIDFGKVQFHDRRRLNEFIRNVQEENPLPDVIGLNEMWDEDLIEHLEGELGELFPYSVRGSVNSAWSLAPDTEAAMHEIQGELDYLALPFYWGWEILQGLGRLFVGNFIGSGLVLLSRYPIVGHKFIPYAAEAGFWESRAEKGVLIAIIQPPHVDAIVGVLLTHTQAGDEDVVRRDQLGQLADIANGLRQLSPRMALLAMGDINVMGEDTVGNPTSEYKDMINLLSLDDTWRHLNPASLGMTYDLSNNQLAIHFCEDGDRTSRLDYILFDPAPSYYIRCNALSCRILKYQSAEEIGDQRIHDVSDHYGVLADYQVEVLPYGTITYAVDSQVGMPVLLEDAATRSLLAWMENAKIGFRRVDTAEEAPLLRIGFGNPESLRGIAAIERLGRVSLNPIPSPVEDNDGSWRWGVGFDPDLRELDLAYSLQHFTGLALHTLSPYAESVPRVLDSYSAEPGSVMLPFDPKRQLAWHGEPDSDHARHLSGSDVDYIERLYGKRSVEFDWRAKAKALADSEVINSILESGLSGTKGALSRYIVSIKEEVANAQAEIPVTAEVHVTRLVWRGRTTETVAGQWYFFGHYEEEEIVFLLEGNNGLRGDKRRAASNTFPRSCSYGVSQRHDTTIDVNPDPFIKVDGITSNLYLDFVVVEDDSTFNVLFDERNKRYSKSEVVSLRQAVNRITSPNGPDELCMPSRRVEYDGAWYADLDICLKANPPAKAEFRRLQEELSCANSHQAVLAKDFKPALASAVREELERVLGEA